MFQIQQFFQNVLFVQKLNLEYFGQESLRTLIHEPCRFAISGTYTHTV